MKLLKRKKKSKAETRETGAWTTDDELNYLKHIGSYAATDEPRTLRRKMQLLRNYIVAAGLRFDWCGMDKGAILRAARHQVYDLEMQIG